LQLISVILKFMPIKKTELYSLFWKSCNELHGEMNASQNQTSHFLVNASTDCNYDKVALTDINSND
jgi:hypothetical protein